MVATSCIETRRQAKKNSSWGSCEEHSSDKNVDEILTHDNRQQRHTKCLLNPEVNLLHSHDDVVVAGR